MGIKHFALLGVLVWALSACGGSSSPSNAKDPNNPTNPNQPGSSDNCTYILAENITVPSLLVNTPSTCDYILEGYVKVSSTLTIEPGVLIKARQDAILWIDGGQIIANGTANAPITMEGLNHISGYWEGIRFAEGRESSFDHFHLKDAGQVCTSLWCPDAGFILDDVTVSFSNSSVSNSYVHGFHATGDVLFKRFENNSFYGNVWAGVVMDANYLEFLDSASDYKGETSPNGTPYVLVANGSLETGDTRTWKNLNVPYLIGGYLNIEGGIVIIEPGTTVVFGEGSWMDVEGNGELRAIGTPDKRITFKGKVEKPGYWDGIKFRDSDWDTNEFSYVDFMHSGNTDSLLSSYGAVRMVYTSSLKINHSHFADNAEFAVACDESDAYDQVTLKLSENSFNNNAAGDIDADCRVVE
ncbi:MAG: hypothetical protein KC422_13125 [Trueperaceae bacterium]|nr:hypothetical protein [Trueperaceae bacterium]